MTRPPRTITRCIIHCSDTPNGRPHTIADIDRWHASRFVRDSRIADLHRPHLRHVGYHAVIQLDGEVEFGRDELEVGAHCAGHNTGSLGVCLIGRDKFTAEQWRSLVWLGTRWYHSYGVTFHGHREFNPGKTCPGFDVPKWLAAGQVVNREHLL